MHTTDSIKNLEIRIGDMELYQVGSCVVEITSEFEPEFPEERQTIGDPGSPGSPANVSISKIVNSQPMQFESDGIKLAIEDGSDIYHLFSKQQIEGMETALLESMREEAL